MMERNELSQRLLNYAVRIIKIVEALPKTIVGKRIGDQSCNHSQRNGQNKRT
jgi:hypothetical protein